MPPPPSAPGGAPDRAPRRARPRIGVLARLAGVTVVVAAAVYLFDVTSVGQLLRSDVDAASTVSVPDGLVSVNQTDDVGPPAEIDNTVFVVGDSVVQAATTPLGELLSDWSLVADTRVSRFIDEGVEVVEDRREEIGDIAVVGLGNNYRGDDEAFAQSVDELLELLDGVDHVIWLSVGQFDDDRAEVNAVLTDPSRRDEFILADWNAWWANEPSFTIADDLHLTDDGADAMATLIARAVEVVTTAANQTPADDPDAPRLRNYDARGRLSSTSTDPDAPRRSG